MRQENRDCLDKSVRALVTAVEARKKYLTRVRCVGYFAPLVVLNGPLYVVNSADERSTPESADHVTFTRTFRSQALDGRYLIDFVTKSGLEAFVRTQLDPFMASLATTISERLREVLPKG